MKKLLHKKGMRRHPKMPVFLCGELFVRCFLCWGGWNNCKFHFQGSLKVGVGFVCVLAWVVCSEKLDNDNLAANYI